MKISTSLRNNNLVVKIAGEIDHHSADMIRNTCEREFAKSGCRNIVFDFAQVGFMDSSGIGMIIGRYKDLQLTGGKLFAINIGTSLHRIFELSGLKKIIQCYDSLEQAEIHA